MSKKHSLKKTFYKETQNILYLEQKMEDALYSSPQFSIEEEEGELFRYKKTRISFRPQHSSRESTWITPEIDTVDFLELTSSTKHLFLSLKERGFSSFYIDRFAECEKYDVALKGEDLKNILLKRVKVSKLIDGKSHSFYQYHLNGGNLYFHHILEKDPNFWLELVKASEETDLVKFSALHLAADCNDNLMENVTQAIKYGHYESDGLKPRAYYVLNGEKKESTVGKYSTHYKDLKEKEFIIQTLYFGDKRRQPVSIVFYDKQKESVRRRNAYSPPKTRIELRFNPLKGNKIPSSLISSLVKSYYHPNGNGFRLCVFLHYLTRNIRFTNHFHEYGDIDLSHWWNYHVLMTLVHAAKSLFQGNILDYVEAKKAPKFWKFGGVGYLMLSSSY